MSIPHFNIPPKGHRAGKPHNAFGAANELRKNGAKKKSGYVSSGWWQENIKEDKTLSRITGIFVLIALAGVVFLFLTIIPSYFLFPKTGVSTR
jgi:hypothetical protein